MSISAIPSIAHDKRVSKGFLDEKQAPEDFWASETHATPYVHIAVNSIRAFALGPTPNKPSDQLPITWPPTPDRTQSVVEHDLQKSERYLYTLPTKGARIEALKLHKFNFEEALLGIFAEMTINECARMDSSWVSSVVVLCCFSDILTRIK